MKNIKQEKWKYLHIFLFSIDQLPATGASCGNVISITLKKKKKNDADKTEIR